MEALFLYFGKMIAVSAVMSAYYLLFLRDKTFHHYNRFYLLLTMVLSLFLPLLKVEYFTIETDSRILLLLNQFNQHSPKVVENSFSFWNLGAAILALVSLFLLAKLTLGLLKIHQLKKEFPKEKIEGITFYNTNLHDAPFSFFRNLFWKKSILLQSDLGKQILKHEMVHIEQKHSFDKLFVQIMQSLFWFNPIFYFIKKEINLIHEYLADKKAVKQADTKAFAQMLLASHFSGNVLPATSPFLSSNLKKRLKMLTQKTTKYSYARRILALPILFLLAFILLVNAKNKEIRSFNASVSKMIKDTAKIDSAKAIITSDISIEAKNAPENALFLIDSKEVSKKEYLEYVEKNKESKDFVQVSMSEGNQPNLMGEKGKNGVYIASTKEGIKNMKGDFHDLIKKYNPKHYNEVIVKNKIQSQKENVSELSKNLQQKTNELKSLKPESKEFQIKIDEINDLSNKIANSENNWKEFEFNFDDLNNEINSKDFKNGMIKIKNLRYSENFDVDVPPMPPMNFENLDKTGLTKEEIKKLEKLAKKQAEIAKKQAESAKEQAELAKKQAEIAKQQAEISRKYAINNPWVISDDPNISKKERIYINANRIKNDSSSNQISAKGINSFKYDRFSENTKIYINGKLSTKEEMDKIKPENITTININRNKNNGKEENEIRIQTK